jgi:hypothetical protein
MRVFLKHWGVSPVVTHDLDVEVYMFIVRVDGLR